MPRTVLGPVAAGLLVAFGALTVLVVVAREVPGDEPLGRLSADVGPHALATVVDPLTGYAGTAVLTAVLVLLLLRLGRRRDAVLSAVSVAGAVVGAVLLKRLVERPRPEALSPGPEVSPFSFPSGHAVATGALAVTVVLSARGTRALGPAVVAGALVVLGAGAAQLVLGLHRASDLVGGWLWAAAWATAVWAVLARPEVPPPGDASDAGA